MFPSRSVVHNQPDAQLELMSSTSEGSSSHDTVKQDQLPSSCVTQSPLSVVSNDQEESMSSSPDQHHVYVPIDQHDATSNSPESPHQTLHPSTSNSDRLKAFREKWLESFDLEFPWLNFCELCSNFSAEARTLAIEITPPRDPNRPSAKKPPIARPPTRNDSNEAKRLQSLYRHSKKRAARLIIGDESPTYSGSISYVESFFENVFAGKPCDTAALKQALIDSVPSVEIDDTLLMHLLLTKFARNFVPLVTPALVPIVLGTAT